ncbi:hypothetical protein EJ05DRAFT_508135 [Pseudovirgaria hyperparasitica]|uniref:Uncharacterized protein n=1 Tax=Pseudovirgaria hyperparasitica TaxID=470096 RepID=A0A6A6WFF9_9PEZI|nr:uncharacterized protein EJ05DRAFT_508135 [Pseudovirgaria hyperparasitica]KAF2760899.1 hypothetical protein EJ05DRAFT_508135 [Pseudovirgaria hyperparasitica]
MGPRSTTETEHRVSVIAFQSLNSRTGHEEGSAQFEVNDCNMYLHFVPKSRDEAPYLDCQLTLPRLSQTGIRCHDFDALITETSLQSFNIRPDITNDPRASRFIFQSYLPRGSYKGVTNWVPTGLADRLDSSNRYNGCEIVALVLKLRKRLEVLMLRDPVKPTTHSGLEAINALSVATKDSIVRFFIRYENDRHLSRHWLIDSVNNGFFSQSRIPLSRPRYHIGADSVLKAGSAVDWGSFVLAGDPSERGQTTLHSLPPTLYRSTNIPTGPSNNLAQSKRERSSSSPRTSTNSTVTKRAALSSPAADELLKRSREDYARSVLYDRHVDGQPSSAVLSNHFYQDPTVKSAPSRTSQTLPELSPDRDESKPVQLDSHQSNIRTVIPLHNRRTPICGAMSSQLSQTVENDDSSRGSNHTPTPVCTSQRSEFRVSNSQFSNPVQSSDHQTGMTDRDRPVLSLEIPDTSSGHFTKPDSAKEVSRKRMIHRLETLTCNALEKNMDGEEDNQVQCMLSQLLDLVKVGDEKAFNRLWSKVQVRVGLYT